MVEKGWAQDPSLQFVSVNTIIVINKRQLIQQHWGVALILKNKISEHINEHYYKGLWMGLPVIIERIPK